MQTYLEDMCQSLKIRLIYVDSPYTILSTGTSNNQPIIKAYHIFRDCPQSVARAIINFYTEPKQKEKALKIIHKFALEYFSPENFEILPPEQEFLALVLGPDTQMTTYSETPKQASLEKEDNKDLKKEEMVEVGIRSMRKKDFTGAENDIDPNETIQPPDDDVVELDIVIDPTYAK